MSQRTLIQSLGEVGLVWPDPPTVRNALAWKPTSEEMRLWRKTVRSTFSVRALHLAWSIFRRSATLQDVSRLENNIEGWETLVRDAPSLAPLLQAQVRIRPTPQATLQPLRDSLLAKGLQPKGWRWLCRQPCDVVFKLVQLGLVPESLQWINVLAIAHPRTVHPGWLEAGRPYCMGQLYSALQGVGDEPLRLLRMLPRQPSAQAMRELEVLVITYLLGQQGRGEPLRIANNSTWKGLLEKVRRINDRRLQAAATVEVADNASWKPVFGETQVKGVHFKELTSVRDLLAEGTAQAHCVGDGAYTERCVTGDHVIARVTESSSQYSATLQLVRVEVPAPRWVIGQLAGIGNSRVPQFFWEATRALQQKLSC